MKVRFTLFLILFLILVPAAFASEGDDQDVNVAQSMREAIGALRELQNAAKEDDYFLIAEKFWNLSVIFVELSHTKAPRGSDKQWKELHAGIVKAAFRGIGACAVGDKKVIDDAVKEISGFQRQGHGEFR